jgi:hypothetical protein
MTTPEPVFGNPGAADVLVPAESATADVWLATDKPFRKKSETKGDQSQRFLRYASSARSVRKQFPRSGPS